MLSTEDGMFVSECLMKKVNVCLCFTSLKYYLKIANDVAVYFKVQIAVYWRKQVFIAF